MDDIDRSIRAIDDLYKFRTRERNARLPTFIGVGAARTATTTLFRFLNRHPDVYMSPIKEINFFGLRGRQPTQVASEYPVDYTMFFLGHEGRRHVGEVSPSYMHHAGAATHMKEVVPNAKIFIQIRDPIERFVSHFKFHSKFHRIDDINVYAERALEGFSRIHDNATNWFQPAKNLQQSFYARAIERYASLFGRENVLVMVYDDLIADPEQLRQKTCRFLDIPLGGERVVRSNESQGSAQVPPDLARRLRTLFEPDVMATSKLLDRDLTGWLAPAAA